MPNLTDDFEKEIERRLKDFLAGKTLVSWCGEVSNDLLFKSEQSRPPFLISKFLPHRRVVAKHDKNLLVTGTTEVTEKGFVIVLNPEKLRSHQYYNFVLAHELAHTFFYNIEYDRPVANAGFSPVSKYLEYLCNKLARYFLIPKGPIEQNLKEFPSIYDSSFNLGFINVLLQLYDINFFTLMTRLIVDEPLLDAIFIQFKYNVDERRWKLFNSFSPRYLTGSGFFIFKFNNANEKRKSINITVKESLNEYLSILSIELESKKRLSKWVALKTFAVKPLNGMFASSHLDESRLMHFSLNKKEKVINVLIPIDDAIIGGEKIQLPIRIRDIVE